MILDLVKIYLLAWLMLCSLSWLITGSFFFFNPQVVLAIFFTERDIIVVLKYKTGKLSYEHALEALKARNPDLEIWELETILLDAKEGF